MCALSAEAKPHNAIQLPNAKFVRLAMVMNSALCLTPIAPFPNPKNPYTRTKSERHKKTGSVEKKKNLRRIPGVEEIIAIVGQSVGIYHMPAPTFVIEGFLLANGFLSMLTALGPLFFASHCPSKLSSAEFISWTFPRSSTNKLLMRG
jgi:hypothetical protein